MPRRSATREMPATGSRTVSNVRTREAHLMPSVVEDYEQRDRPSNGGGGAASGPSSRGDQEFPIEVALQTLIRDMIVDGELARQMEVSPSRTIQTLGYLTERDKRRLSTVDPQIVQSLAEAAQRYVRAIGRKQQVGQGIGMKEDPLGRVPNMDDFGGGRGRTPGDVAGFIPGRRTGVNVLGRGVVTGGGGGGSGGGRRGYGGLGRGMGTALGLPGGGGTDLPDVDGGFGRGPSGPGMDEVLGLIEGLGLGGGPFGSDPLVNALTWHRQNPGGAASDDPKKDAGGNKNKNDAGKTKEAGAPPPPSAAPAPTPTQLPGDPNSPAGGPHHATPPPQSEGYGGKDKQVADHSIVVDIVVGGVLGAVGGWMIGKGLGAAVGAVVVGGLGAYVHETQHKRPPEDGHRPADDGSGPVGPRTHESARFRPADDGGGPVGPWSRQGRTSQGHSLNRHFMPAPDDPGGGGPWSNLFLPNPEDDSPGTPRSRSAAGAAVADIASATHALMSRR